MGIMGMLGLAVITGFAITVYWIVTGIQQKNWKRVLFPAAGFLAGILLLYWGLLFFITAM